jgi:Amt family ammonium transporter
MASAAEAVGGSWTTFDQLKIQLTAVGITVIYSAIVSLILVVLVDKTVGFRLDKDNEMAGMDHSQHSEHGYGLINPN